MKSVSFSSYVFPWSSHLATETSAEAASTLFSIPSFITRTSLSPDQAARVQLHRACDAPSTSHKQHEPLVASRAPKTGESCLFCLNDSARATRCQHDPLSPPTTSDQSFSSPSLSFHFYPSPQLRFASAPAHRDHL